MWLLGLQLHTDRQILLVRLGWDIAPSRKLPHDARLKTLNLNEPFATGAAAIVLTPAFDPDILRYEVNQSLVGAQIDGSFFDTLLSFAANVRTNVYTTSLTLTATANDGISRRTYAVHIAD